jgi:hypothetical protein
MLSFTQFWSVLVKSCFAPSSGEQEEVGDTCTLAEP